MGSSRKHKEHSKKKRKRERSKSREKDKYHRHHKRKKRRKREDRSHSKSLSLSDISLTDSDLNEADSVFQAEDQEELPESYKDFNRRRQETRHYETSSSSSTHKRQDDYEPPAKVRRSDDIDTVPKTSDSNEISLSVEETNRLRAKMGLKPLNTSKNVASISNDADKDDYVAGQEVHKPAENLRDKLEVEKLRTKIAAQKEKRKLTEKLKKTKTLGESDEDDENVSAWVLKSRKTEKEKREAEKRNKILEELDAQFGVGDIVEEEIRQEKKNLYGSRNLSGMKVQHGLERFTEGSSVILTLQDSNVLEDNEDTLVNVNIEDNERTERNIRNRLKKKDETDSDPFNEFEDKNVLTKYDTEISGEKKKSFRIGSEGEGAVSEPTPAETQARKMAKLRQTISLSVAESQLANEYMTEEESSAKFKKVKKKKKKKMLKADDLIPIDDGTEHLGRRGPRHSAEENGQINRDVDQPKTIRQLIEEEEQEQIKNESMDVDEPPMETEEPDDFELQEAISRSRRVKDKMALNIDHLRDLPLEEEDSKPSIDAMDLLKPYPSSEENLNMTLNLTDEFCRTLGEIPTYGLSGNRADEDSTMIQEEEPTKPAFEKQSGAWEEVGIDDSKVEIGDEQGVVILEEEPDTGKGVVNALKLAIKKGYLDKGQTKKTSNAALQHLRAVNYSIEDKVMEDDRSSGRDHHHRYTGPTMEFREKDSYKPDVKLDYVDDDGRKLSAKEAFRYLSHKFHGKGSGKNKLEKRMKKWQEELLMKHMSSSDTPLQTLERQREKQKSIGTPYLVLTGAKQEVLDIKK